MTAPVEPTGEQDDVPRHLRIALANAQRAFEKGDLGALATINEDIQQLADAAVSWGRQERDAARRGMRAEMKMWADDALAVVKTAADRNKEVLTARAEMADAEIATLREDLAGIDTALARAGVFHNIDNIGGVNRLARLRDEAVAELATLRAEITGLRATVVGAGEREAELRAEITHRVADVVETLGCVGREVVKRKGAVAERDHARKMLAECYVLSGADTDGNTLESGWEHLWDGAVDGVRELRQDYDEAIKQSPWPTPAPTEEGKA